jgi:hypothetical protein
MAEDFEKVLLVLNDIEDLDQMLKVAQYFTSKRDTILEILFVYEKAFFDLPDLFAHDGIYIDKDKIKKAIKKIVKKECAIFVYIDNSAQRVIQLTKNQEDILIITKYHKKITKNLIKNLTKSILILKNQNINFEKLIIPITIEDRTNLCIQLTSTIFPTSDIKLLYAFRHLLSKELKNREYKEYESIKKKFNLKGETINENFSTEIEFIEELYIVQKDISKYINERDFDLTIFCRESPYIDLIDMVENNILSF